MSHAAPSGVAERFEVIALAGRGGMASVYRAIRRATGEVVALKIVPADEAARKRFAREASALEMLDHAGIVRYRDHGELADGRFFLAMEWIEGESLGERLRRSRMPLRDALVLGAKIARALATVHGAGLVHRDVKPGNVILRSGDPAQPVLLDFGLVKPVVGDEVTSVGFAVGTPGYMAPEQARGTTRFDGRVDIFALACLLYRCATGARAFAGPDATAILTKLLFDSPPAMRTIDPRISSELDRLVARMFAKNPEERPRDALEVAVELERLASREAPSLPSASAVALTPDEQLPVSVVVVAAHTLDADTIVAPVEASEVLLKPVAAPMERDAVVALAESFGGVAETLANGALVVVFEGSTNARDQCMRAARCALRLKSLVPERTVVLASGRGRSSGGSIVGEAIDRAVHCLRGEVGEGVRVEQASIQLLEPRFEVMRDGPAPVLLREHAEALATRTLLGAPTPCVGRDAELGVVAAALQQCIEEGASRVVAVTADAGVGKSRLASEIALRATSAHPDLAVWLARGDVLLERSPLALVAKMIRDLARIVPSEPPEAQEALLRARVALHVPADEVVVTTAFLGEICGIHMGDEGLPALRGARSDPQLMANHLSAAFERFVVAEASAHPVLLVVEDLHWADAISVAYLQKVVARLASAPVLLLVLGRSEAVERFPSLHGGATHVRMRPLSAKAATKLAEAVLGARASRETITRVVELAAGNAFYLEELIRAVAEQQGALPETVVLMAQARLQALDPEARRVLRAASVVGDAFTEDDVSALEGGRIVAPWMATLVDGELLTRDASAQTYSFRHALLREAAYASLTDEDRALGHKLVARRLEAKGDRNAMGIADHYARGGEPSAAVSAYLRASERALEAGDFEVSALALERGKACGASGETLGQLEGLAARGAWLRGDMVESERLGREALGKLRPGQTAWYHVIADLGNAMQGRLDHTGVEALSLALLDGPVPKPPTAAYSRAVSLCYTLVIQNTPATPLAQRLTSAIDALAQAADPSDPLVGARVAVARAFGAVVRREPSAALFELAASRMELVGNSEIARMQRNSQATALGWLGAWEEAIAVLERVSESAGRAWWWTRVTLGWSLAQVGLVDRAIATLEPILREARDDTFLVLEVHLALARVDIMRSRPREALDRVGRALAENPNLPSAMTARFHAAAFEAACAVDPEKCPEHGEAIERALESGVTLVEDAVYVRWMASRSKQRRGDLEGARALAAATRRMIVDYGAGISSAEERERYETRVRENAGVLALARELGVG